MSQIKTKFLEDLSVTQAKLAADSVATAKIQDNAVTNAKVATGLDAAKIANGSVSNTEFQYLANVTSDIQDQLDDKVDESLLGANNGVATLDAGGKVPASQLPNSVMEFKGQWNANTNTPTLADGTGNAGDVYRTEVAGTVDLGSGNIVFEVGDWVMYSGTVWQKASNSNLVSSVNGQQGVVVLDTDDISEGTALYFTDERAQDAVGNALTDSARIDFTYDDIANTITADIIANSVDGSRIRLQNDQFLRARNAANDADLPLIKLDTSNRVTISALSSGNPIVMNGNVISGDPGMLSLGSAANSFSTAYISAILDTSSNTVLDVPLRELRDDSGGLSVAFSIRTLYDTAGDQSLDYGGRQLIDSASSVAFNWETRELIDSANNVAFTFQGTELLVERNSGSPRILRFLSSSGTTGVGVRSPNTVANSYDLTLPNSPGSSGQVLQTDGNGTLSWVTPASSAPAFQKQTIVLASGDITNQYVDLSAEAVVGSISVLIRGAGAIFEGASYEYTVDYTGGSGGVTRISFENDIATGGASELVVGDVLQITFVEA
jgi:hypothetical protein